MDAKIINPFISSTANVLSTMCQTSPTAGKPVLKTSSTTWGQVTGVIGMAGETVSGNMILSFDQGSILAIVSKMLMEEFTEINKEVVDAVGEITNMISGGAKRELSEQGLSFNMATPIVLEGQGVALTQIGSAPIISIPFQTGSGSFVVEASIQSKKKG